ELSKKVFAGKCRLIELGFRQGGHAGYGLRRVLVDQGGKPKGVLKRGERKSIFTDRVILIPGPEDEIRVVQRIYSEFIEARRFPRAIAADLNSRGVLSEHRGRWTRAIVYDIPTNPKYVRTNLFHRRSYALTT